ncbi:LytR C-terminal domain-containing protein [Agrococcus sp. HG114]|uniref:LytR C-terminal domain-containing protein n=1 Tax=Agrococcus sp. HG114 TaxID=2969757 RepID=UPI00215A22D3|nr:LytR C-terminal domain-containing protein [Agrococcus sp. HG114]MCR8670768.1 LytR C-terminal domain-containing protein [Agrococcus sp. HG114]
MSPTQRVGAHRSASSPRAPRWAILLGALAAVVVLTAAGLFLLDRLRPQATAPTQVATDEPEVVSDPGQVDPGTDASITVLDQTGERGFAAGVGQALADAGWSVVATGASTGGDAQRTVVWYDAPELAPVARGLAQGIGVGEARQSDGRLSGTPITIVLGTDAVGTAPSVEPRHDGDVSHSPTPTAP